MDTIAALATPSGRGAVAVIRISGPDAYRAAEVLCGKTLRARYAHFVTLSCSEDRRPIDQGLAIYFPAPASFTGEDVVELQLHASPATIELTLSALVALGVRMARPGEFSERAYCNGKIDLNQAEAIADLIAASSADAARSAIRTLQGDFSRDVDALLAELIQARVALEARLDFPEEEIPAVDADDIARIRRLLASASKLSHASQRGATLIEGVAVVVVGAPNVGKSSIFNRLMRHDLAIVADIPGTTRDLVRGETVIDGVPVRFLDTAGLHETDDVVEREGIRRGLQAIHQADVILHVYSPDVASTLPKSLSEILESGDPRIVHVQNKADLALPGRPPAALQSELVVSAKSGQGLDALRRQIIAVTQTRTHSSSEAFSARPRHIEAISRVLNAVERAEDHALAGAAELAAEALRESQEHLATITGRFDADDLLGEIFSNFCIGK